MVSWRDGQVQLELSAPLCPVAPSPAVQESPAPSLAWCQGTGRSQPTFFLLSIWFYLNHESAPGNQSSERKSTQIKGREPPTASAMWRAASFLTQAPSPRGGCPRLHSLLRKQDPRCKVTHPRSQVEKNLSQAAGPQSHTCNNCAHAVRRQMLKQLPWGHSWQRG